MKNVLFVVDERKMGGVSVLLEDMMHMIDISNLNIDILVLHDNGDRLNNLPGGVNVIYGTKYFDTIDLTIKEVLKTHNIGIILRKIRLVLDMKCGFVKQKIKKERKKILNKSYDIEIAFKDGFTAIFVGYGECQNKIHWLHYDYKIANPNAKYNKLFLDILPKFNKIIAVSKGVMDDFNLLYHLKSKTIVINNLVDIDKIINRSKDETSIETSKLQIVSVGRLHYMKGYDRLIDAIIMLKNESLLKNVEFKIYGDGPEQTNLKEKILNNSLEQEVRLMGRTNNPYKAIKNADLFVLSSIYEPFGLVIVEAMTIKVPVLATSNSATGDLIKNDYNGLIVPNNIEGLYEGLKNIILNPTKLKELKLNLKQYNYQNHNNYIINQLNELFR